MMQILHISDIHYRLHYPPAKGQYEGIFETMTSPLRLLKNCQERLKEEGKKVDAVLVSGDLTEGGQAEDYRELKKVLQSLFPQIPVIAALGNHDCREAFYEGWLEQKRCSVPYRHVVKLKELQVIVLDNEEPEAYPDGRITEEDCIWLEERLKEAGKSPVLLMMHHQVNNSDVVPPCIYPPRFTELVDRKNVLGICCGHTHHYCKGMISKKPYYIAGSMSFIGLDSGEKGLVRFKERYGYNYYTIENAQIQSEEMVSFDTGKDLGIVAF